MNGLIPPHYQICGKEEVMRVEILKHPDIIQSICLIVNTVGGLGITFYFQHKKAKTPK